MRPPILLPILVALSIAGCGRAPEMVQPDSPLDSELKLLERQVASLKAAIKDARGGGLFSPGDIAIGVSQGVVQSTVSQALPIQKPIGTEFMARIDRATVLFASMQGSVTLEGRVWALAQPETYADLVLLGGIQEVNIDRRTGVLEAEIVLDGWDVKRAAAAGMEFEWTKSLVQMLGDRGLAALRDLAPPVRIPVGIEQGIDLPGVSGGPVTIPSGRLPLDAKVSRVLPLSGRLWAMLSVSTSGWERTVVTKTPQDRAVAPRGRKAK
jgi:hypothetical protein